MLPFVIRLHGVDVGDDQRAQLKEGEKIEKPVRVSATNLHHRQILATELWLASGRSISLPDHRGEQEPLRRAFDEHGLVSEE